MCTERLPIPQQNIENNFLFQVLHSTFTMFTQAKFANTKTIAISAIQKRDVFFQGRVVVSVRSRIMLDLVALYIFLFTRG